MKTETLNKIKQQLATTKQILIEYKVGNGDFKVVAVLITLIEQLSVKNAENTCNIARLICDRYSGIWPIVEWCCEEIISCIDGHYMTESMEEECVEEKYRSWME